MRGFIYICPDPSFLIQTEAVDKRYDSVYSNKVRAGKRRTYFFDVRQTKGDDYYITLTESTKKFENGGYERHKLFLYKEDFNRFLNGLEDAIDYVKTELLPDYDYDEFTRRQEEYEARRAAEDEAYEKDGGQRGDYPRNNRRRNDNHDDYEEQPRQEPKQAPVQDDDMSW